MEASGPNQVRWREARRERLQGALLTCFVFVVCFLTAELGGMLEIRAPQPIWLLWPGCAILSALLFIQPRRTWWFVLPAGLAGFVFYDVRAGLPISSILWLILIDVCEILTATLGVRSISSKDAPLDLGSVRGLAKYCVFAVILAPVVSATMGAYGPSETYWTRWRIIFFSEALAFLTLPPAVLGCASQIRQRNENRPSRWPEAVFLTTGVLALGYVISVTSTSNLMPALFYALVPFLIWSALRFGPLGVSVSILIVAFLSIWGAVRGRGPFTAATTIQNVLSLQLFLLCAATPFMVLAALAEQHKRFEKTLQELGGQLISAQDEERTRISRELHDDLSQRMARLLLRLERWRHSMGGMSEKSLGQFDTIIDMASEVSASLRDLSHLLHPATLATLGLVPSIESYCRKFSEHHNISVRFDCRDIPQDTPQNLRLCLFRVVQESLRNVVKHSGAREARVTLTRHGNAIDLCIEDFGNGFDTQTMQQGGTLGLISMRERARLVGGQLSIESDPGIGTRIFLEAPLSGVPVGSRTSGS